jgi:beta-glucanase (GH16 family)
MSVKKYLCLVLTILLVSVITACGINSVSTTTSTTQNASTSTDTTVTTTSLTTSTTETTLTTSEPFVDLSMYDFVNGRLITLFDDFDGDQLDESIWEHMTGTGSAYGLGYWGNNEKQFYKPENTTIRDGYLQIQVRKEQTVADNGSGTIMNYTSSRIRTKGRFAQAYGRFEARIRIDTAEQGLWPAFWLLPEQNRYGNWPYSGELDIMELRGSKPYFTTAATHYYDGRHTYISGERQYPNAMPMTEFHVYAVEWTPTKITYYVDDEVVVSMSSWNTQVGDFPAPFDQEFHILLNFAVGGNFDSNLLPSDSKLPATMYVDYVKVLAIDNETGRKPPAGTGSVYLTYDQMNLSLSEGAKDLEYFVFNGYRSDVAWFSSNPEVAVVNQFGRVTPRREGTTIIRVATGTFESICVITVVP